MRNGSEQRIALSTNFVTKSIMSTKEFSREVDHVLPARLSL